MQMLTAIQIEYGEVSILGERHITLVRHAFRVMEAHGGCQTYNRGQICLEITPGNT